MWEIADVSLLIMVYIGTNSMEESLASSRNSLKWAISKAMYSIYSNFSKETTNEKDLPTGLFAVA